MNCNRVRRKFPGILIMLSMCILSASAQNSTKVKGINTPDWVKSINDPNTNYFKAIKEYENYWKNHEKPTDEEELMNKGTETVKKHIKSLSRREIKHQRVQDYYRYQCKRFENWVRENKAYVQQNGHILNADERLKLWQQSQKERQ